MGCTGRERAAAAARLLRDRLRVAGMGATNGIFAGRDDAKKGPMSPFAPTFRSGNCRPRQRSDTGWSGRAAGHRASHAGGRWAAQRRKPRRTLERNDSDPRGADALAAAGGVGRRGRGAVGLYDDAVDRQLAADAIVDADVGRDARRDRRLLPRQPGRHARERRGCLRAARAGRRELEPHVAQRRAVARPGAARRAAAGRDVAHAGAVRLRAAGLAGMAGYRHRRDAVLGRQDARHRDCRVGARSFGARRGERARGLCRDGRQGIWAARDPEA
ncbi:hypothetical protein BVI434_360040 [Burkholderia vietnamiensis]|nr:hypothetical protein BVI1335_270015 [Burkholderia vietnamiensis]CAG9219085.1 hypothetical protein BVI434_360040 [Burkholderia vietnamiensis]